MALRRCKSIIAGWGEGRLTTSSSCHLSVSGHVALPPHAEYSFQCPVPLTDLCVHVQEEEAPASTFVTPPRRRATAPETSMQPSSTGLRHAMPPPKAPALSLTPPSSTAAPAAPRAVLTSASGSADSSRAHVVPPSEATPESRPTSSHSSTWTGEDAGEQTLPQPPMTPHQLLRHDHKFV